jgi:hypothetical protein
MAEATTRATERGQELLDAAPTDALREAGQRLLGLLLQRATQVATDRVGDLTDRLTDYAEHGGPGLASALTGGKGLAEGKSPMGAGLSGLKEKVKNLFGGGGGGSGKKLKMTNIVESIDVGLPLRTTYDLWTQFADFPSFMKKVESVEQASDEKTNWKAQVFWSHRTWEATISEQVPDSHIVWRSKGEKGRVDGAVTFTELGPNLTRVLLVLEYWPQGLFERTGNLWRAQGRRARLEFKHFRRHAMSNVLLRQEEVEGWRGEIRDSEVVRTHEEALEEEQRAEEEAASAPEAEAASADEAEPEEAEAEPAEARSDEAEGDEYPDEYADEEYGDEEADEYDEDEEEDEEEEDGGQYDEDEYEDEDQGAEDSGDVEGRREQPVSARAGRER